MNVIVVTRLVDIHGQFPVIKLPPHLSYIAQPSASFPVSTPSFFFATCKKSWEWRQERGYTATIIPLLTWDRNVSGISTRIYVYIEADTGHTVCYLTPINTHVRVFKILVRSFVNLSCNLLP